MWNILSCCILQTPFSLGHLKHSRTSKKNNKIDMVKSLTSSHRFCKSTTSKKRDVGKIELAWLYVFTCCISHEFTTIDND